MSEREAFEAAYNVATQGGAKSIHELSWFVWQAARAAPQQAEAVRWRPDVCPITGKPFFMWIGHPKHGDVPAYGGPYDSYTIPVRHEDGSFCCERYDHDNGWWVTDEMHDVGVQIVSDQAYVSDEAPQQAEAVPRDVVRDAMVEAACDAVAAALGDAYDCVRVWSAWSCGTMGPDAFSQVSEDCDRVREIAVAAIDAAIAAAPKGGM